MTFLFYVLIAPAVSAQGPFAVLDLQAKDRKMIDSLRPLLRLSHPDSTKVNMLLSFSAHYIFVDRDSSLLYCQQALALAEKINDTAKQGRALRRLVDLYSQRGNHTKALALAFHYQQLARKRRDTLDLFWATRSVWRCYSQMLDHHKTLEYTRQVKAIVHSGFFKDETERKRYALSGYLIASHGAHAGLKNTDSAFYYIKLAFETASAIQDTNMLAIAGSNLSKFYIKNGNIDKAFSLEKKIILWAAHVRRSDLVGGVYGRLAEIYLARKQFDSALHYGKVTLNLCRQSRSPIHEQFASTFLSEVYEQKGQFDSAFKYQSITMKLKDSLFSLEKIKETESIAFDERLRNERAERDSREAKERYNNRMKIYGLAGGLILLSSIAFFRYRLMQIRNETRIKASFNKKIHQIEMRALRAQMNPHFIFNCLNSINRYIVKSDHKTASSYLTKFARLIRMILDNSASDIISLDQEIQTLQLYVEMEVLRFDHAFDYCLEVDEGILPETVKIPSMLLQPYVENAIWHGLLHREAGGGKLWIRFRQTKDNWLVAEIEDNGIGRRKAKELRSKEVIRKKSYGMQISQDRIFLINELYNTNANVSVHDLTDRQGNATGTKVTVVLPATAA
jgi:tetratricopeptide (TPR) repeat protein